jgi:Xaa-Pro dipeptidase
LKASAPDSGALERFVRGHRSELEAVPPDYDFTREEYADRVRRVRTEMEKAGVDLLLVSAPDAICYLHGHRLRWYHAQAPLAWPPLACTAVHVDHDKPVHFDFAGEANPIRHNSVLDDVRFFPGDNWAPGVSGAGANISFLVRELNAMGWLTGRVATERASYVPNRLTGQAIDDAIAASGPEVVDGSKIQRVVRGLKSPREIEYIEAAAKIADAGVSAAGKALVPGVSELEVWAEMMSAMVAAGGEPAAIHELVAIGSIGEGHQLSSHRRVSAGDFVLADPCGVVARYHANVSRTFYVGDEPPVEAQRLLELAAGGFEVLCATAVPGTPLTTVNRALRTYYEDAGIWDLRSWVGGYELGLSLPPDWVGEFQFTVEESEQEGTIEAGLVTNFESIFHFPLLDTMVVGEDGGRCLSTLPLGLLAAG